MEGEIIQPGQPGRPTVMTKATVAKLTAAFNNGFNVTEACQYASIDRATFYRALERDAVFAAQMAAAQNAPNMKAKEMVINAINNGDANLAFRYLERRDPDFKPKGEMEVNAEQQQTRDKIKEFLDDGDDINGPNAPSTEPARQDSGSAGAEVAPTTPDIS